jgi:hypothetical protein
VSSAPLTPEQLAFRKYVYPVIEFADKHGDHAPLLAVLEGADPSVGRIYRRLFEDTEDPTVASILLLFFMENEKVGKVTALEYYLFGDPIDALMQTSRLLGSDGPAKLRRIASEEGMSLPS